jgi:hypothetical protein
MPLSIPNAVVRRRYRTRSSKKPTFLTLPAKVKNIIYEEVFRDAKFFCMTWMLALRARGHALLKTSKTVYTEAIDLYYKHATLELGWGARPGGAPWTLPQDLIVSNMTLSNMHRIQKLRLDFPQERIYMPILPQWDNLQQVTMVDTGARYVDSKAEISTPSKVQGKLIALLSNRHATFKEWRFSFKEGLDVRFEYRLRFDACHSELLVSILLLSSRIYLLTNLARWSDVTLI